MSEPTRPLITVPRPPVSASLAPLQPWFPALESVTPEIIVAIRTRIASPTDVSEIIKNRPLTHTEHHIPGPDGNAIALSIFRRSETAVTPRPCLFYLHGGGMMFGDRFHLIKFPLSVALETGALIIIPEYRLIPEYPAPAAVEDGYAALQWTFAHAAELGIDEKKVMIGGLSGGGAVAAGLALLWRDRTGPPLCGQFLSCPMLDHRVNTLSASQYGDGNITATLLRKAWEFALGPRHLGDANVSIYASPAIAQDLKGVPTSFIDVGSAESLRDEAVAYAAKLWESGVQCELHVWAGGFHGYEEFVPEDELSIKSRRARLEWIKKSFEA